MFTSIEKILTRNNILHHPNQGITVCVVAGQNEGVYVAKDMLYTIVDTKTALYLSGGRTPRELYEQLADEERLSPGAVGQVDERFGEPLHANSNQKMMKEVGLLRYFEMRDIPFYPMLNRHGSERKFAAEKYDEKVRSLNATFQKNVAILGIGSDGHTAGIAGNRLDFTNPLFEKNRQYDLVSEFDDEKGAFKERITMTFLGLSMLDVLVVLVFGNDKKEALVHMFEDGSEEEIPARFYKRSDIASKTIIITDQHV